MVIGDVKTEVLETMLRFEYILKDEKMGDSFVLTLSACRLFISVILSKLGFRKLPHEYMIWPWHYTLT